MKEKHKESLHAYVSLAIVTLSGASTPDGLPRAGVDSFSSVSATFGPCVSLLLLAYSCSLLVSSVSRTLTPEVHPNGLVGLIVPFQVRRPASMLSLWHHASLSRYTESLTCNIYAAPVD